MKQETNDELLCISCLCFSSYVENSNNTRVYCKYNCYAATPKKGKKKKCTGYRKRNI